MGRRLRDPNAIPLANRNTPMPDVAPPPIEPYPVAGGPDLSPLPVDQYTGTPADQRLGKFTDPAVPGAVQPPAPGAYNTVRNAARGPAMPFVKPGTALAIPSPAGPPATIPGRPAIPMGGPEAPAPAPQGPCRPRDRKASSPPPAPPWPQRPAIPMGGANAYTPPNAGGASEAIGGATPNRTGKFAGSLRPPPANGFNIVREPLGLPGPPRPAPAAPPPPPPPIDPFDMRTAQRGGTFSRAQVQTPGSYRQTYGGPSSLRTPAPATRLGTAVRSVGPMVALGAASDPEGFAHAVGHPLEAMGGMVSSAADGLSGLFDGRFRAGARRLVTGDGDAWKYALLNAPVASQIHAAGQNMGKGAAEWIKDPGQALQSYGRGYEKLVNGVFGPAPEAPGGPPTPQAPDVNPNGLTPEFLAQVQGAGGDPASYGMLGGQLVSMPGAKPPAPQAPAQPGAGATADQLNAFWNSQGVGPGAKALAPTPSAPAQAQRPAPTVPANSRAVASPDQRQMRQAHQTLGLLNRQMRGLQAQFDRYQNPEFRAGIAQQMANLGNAIAQATAGRDPARDRPGRASVDGGPRDTRPR
jgi:hypothetical protein